MDSIDITSVKQESDMKKLLVAALLTAATGSAFAAESGDYVFGNIGISSNQWTLKDGAANKAGVANRKVQDDDAGSGLFEIGAGRRLNDNFAVEGSYLRHGSANRLAGAGTLDYDTFRVAALGIIPVNEQFDVYGKVSANYIRSTFTSSSNALSGSKDNSLGMGLGIGAAYHVNKALTARVEYEGIGNIHHQDITDSAPVAALKLGLGYRF